MAAPLSEVVVKWSGKEYRISGLFENQKVFDLKKAIQNETGVLPERQKLLGLKYKGGYLSKLFKCFNYRPLLKFILCGFLDLPGRTKSSVVIFLHASNLIFEKYY